MDCCFVPFSAPAPPSPVGHHRVGEGRGCSDWCHRDRSLQ